MANTDSFLQDLFKYFLSSRRLHLNQMHRFVKHCMTFMQVIQVTRHVSTLKKVTQYKLSEELTVTGLKVNLMTLLVYFHSTLLNLIYLHLNCYHVTVVIHQIVYLYHRRIILMQLPQVIKILLSLAILISLDNSHLITHSLIHLPRQCVTKRMCMIHLIHIHCLVRVPLLHHCQRILQVLKDILYVHRHSMQVYVM